MALPPSAGLLFDRGNASFAHIASGPLDPDAARIWAASESVRSRMAVAANLDTSKDILHELARDRESEVRAMVASNPNALLDTAYLLTGDLDPAIADTAMRKFTISRNQLVADHEYVIKWAYR